MVAQVAEVRSLAADLGITCIMAVKLDATRCLVEQQQEDQQAARRQAGSVQAAGAGETRWQQPGDCLPCMVMPCVKAAGRWSASLLHMIVQWMAGTG